MKILFDHSCPFFLAHGGVQVQIEQTKAALERVGVEVEYLRWWDDTQTGDIIHYFGRPRASYIDLAHGKKIKVILADLLTAQGSRSAWVRFMHGRALASLERTLPKPLRETLSSRSYASADACFALTPWEALLMEKIYGAKSEKVYVIPNGVEELFLNEPARVRGQWLVSTATITERKRVLELAESAIIAQTPLWILGRPYSEGEAYFKKFLSLAATHPNLIRYEGAINDRYALARIYREARGFVLLSTMESLSLSALEAAAGECPLLLSDLPWARHSFGDRARYCPVTKSIGETARVLSAFYHNAPLITPPARPKTWLEVAGELQAVYQKTISEDRSEI